MSDTKILSIDDILNATELETKTVEIPELGGAVRIRAFTKGQQQQMRRTATDRKTNKLNTDQLELLIFINGVVEPQFTIAHVEKLREIRASVIDRVITEISELSGMTDEAVEEEAETFQE